MTRLVAGMTMSLDGYINDRAGRTDQLYADLADWRTTEHGQESIAKTGAVLMGRRTFEMAGDPDAYVDHYEYRVPIFVVTQSAPPAHPREAHGLTFEFVDDGIEAAVARAKAAARGRQVTVVGGATLIQSLLAVNLVDALELDVIPVLLHGGTRLFEHLEGCEPGFRRTGMSASPSGRISLTFDVRADD